MYVRTYVCTSHRIRCRHATYCMGLYPIHYSNGMANHSGQLVQQQNINDIVLKFRQTLNNQKRPHAHLLWGHYPFEQQKKSTVELNAISTYEHSNMRPQNQHYKSLQTDSSTYTHTHTHICHATSMTHPPCGHSLKPWCMIYHSIRSSVQSVMYTSCLDWITASNCSSRMCLTWGRQRKGHTDSKFFQSITIWQTAP